MAIQTGQSPTDLLGRLSAADLMLMMACERDYPCSASAVLDQVAASGIIVANRIPFNKRGVRWDDIRIGKKRVNIPDAKKDRQNYEGLRNVFRAWRQASENERKRR